MRSVKLLVKGLKTTGTCLVILMVLQAFGPGTGWPQDSDQRIDEEFAKQEEIYQSQGDDVPSGYVTDRGLSGYADLLPTGFCEALGSLGSSDRWLDIGAGSGQAILDYYAPKDSMAPAKKCVRSGVKARAVAVSIEDRRTDKWRKLAASLGGDRIRYLCGKRFRHFSRDELGKFQIITDVFGAFSYTEDLSQFMEKVLGLLEVGGAFYTLVQNVHLEDGKDKPDETMYQTELRDRAGNDVKVCSWLKNISCVNVTCESKSDWERPTELINIRKVCSDISIPRMVLLDFESGNPPTRRFLVEP
ncbi:MAG: class I SAM-dependent methyltransferase [Thermodesulfobacteriota bacterium]